MARPASRRLHRSRLQTALVLAAVATVAAACGGSSGGANGKGGQTSKSVPVGVMSVLSGGTPAPGFAHGAQEYFKVLNAKGGVNGYKVNTFVADSANEGPQSVTVARSLLAQHHIKALISFATVPAKALIPIQPSLGVPMLLSSDGDLYVPGKPFLYSAIPSYTSMWKYATQLVKSHFNKTTVSLAYQNDAFGAPAQESVPGQAKSLGIHLAADVAVPNNITSNFTPYGARLKKAGAPIVILTLGHGLTAGIIKSSEQLGYHPIWLTNWGAEDPGLIKTVGDSVMSRVYAIDFYKPVATTDTPAYQDYKTAMGKAYPDEVADQFAEQGWTYAAILAYAIGQASQNSSSVTPAAINDALANINGIPLGLLDSVKYTPENHSGVSQMALLQFQQGAFKQLGPFEQLPPPGA